MALLGPLESVATGTVVAVIIGAAVAFDSDYRHELSAAMRQTWWNIQGKLGKLGKLTTRKKRRDYVPRHALI